MNSSTESGTAANEIFNNNKINKKKKSRKHAYVCMYIILCMLILYFVMKANGIHISASANKLNVNLIKNTLKMLTANTSSSCAYEYTHTQNRNIPLFMS